ncbi:MAG: hypothetical protein KGL53_03525, partial [Elusimicrobia bacterium]|nr:hypothetical protein [Elusimicrobiota bacterium]
AWAAWGVCVLYFAGPLFFVKLAALQHRAAAAAVPAGALERMRRAGLAYHAAALAVVVLASAARALPLIAPLPFLASLLKTWSRGRKGPHKVDFRRLGYQEVAYSCFFAGVLAFGLLSAWR